MAEKNKILPRNEEDLQRFPFYKKIGGRDFFFIHIPKTAGTSIARGLKLPKSERSMGIHKHYPVYKIQQAIAPELWKKAYRACFIRNPWDRTFSYYRYRARKGKIDREEHLHSFEAWLKYELVEQRPYKENLRPQIHWLRDQQGQVDMSFIGRFERLEADFRQICEVLGVAVVLPHRTASLPKMDYRMQYTDELAEIVQDFYREDIAYFNYSFDG
ncbi:MAG: sulfotransferase family 2 domain-containing protein [Bacteroidota bacterium]